MIGRFDESVDKNGIVIWFIEINRVHEKTFGEQFGKELPVILAIIETSAVQSTEEFEIITVQRIEGTGVELGGICAQRLRDNQNERYMSIR